MKDKYLVVDKSILPPYYEKVVEAKRLIQDGKAKNVSDAINQVGLSRNSYYKYKDFVMEMSEDSQGSRAIISLTLNHEPGILAKIINIIASYGYSIWTINQNPPMNDQANIVIDLEMSEDSGDVDEMLADMRTEAGTIKASLIGVK